MDFTTQEKVRISSWFDGNTNISNEYIQEFVEEATGIVASYVWARYWLTAFWYWQWSLNSNFVGSQADKMLTRITTLLASGNLLIDQYGEDSYRGPTSDWNNKIAKAMELCQSIAVWELRLMGNDLNEFPKAPISSDPTQWLTGWTWLQWRSWKKYFKIDQQF